MGGLVSANKCHFTANRFVSRQRLTKNQSHCNDLNNKHTDANIAMFPPSKNTSQHRTDPDLIIYKMLKD